MSIHAQPVAYAPVPTAQKRPWRLIPQIDQDPKIVASIQSSPGRFIVAGTVALLTILFNVVGLDFLAGLLALASAYAEKYRSYLIAVMTWLLLYRSGFWFNAAFIEHLAAQEGVADRITEPLLQSSMLAFTFVLFSGLLLLRRGTPRALPRPTLALLTAFLGLVFTTQLPLTAGLPRVLLWSFLMTAQPFLWFMAYALADASKERAPIWQHFGVFHPFWGSTLTPFGKGLAYLQRFEAKTPSELAVTQLKGLKLAAWILLLAACQKYFVQFVHGYLALPIFDNCFLQYAGGDPGSRLVGWVSLMAYFVEDLLGMTVSGGIIVSAARLAGFRLLRNTYRPLEATTLVDFWNRYYFYYKELLVDHFFYPTFLRYFRRHRRLRLFFATFSAACVGNLLFHFIRDIHFVGEMGLWQAVIGDQSHAFYTLLLATSVGLSQLRSAPRRREGHWLRARALPCLWVCGFFCILHIFDAPLDREHLLWQRAGFLFYLLGIST
jgi:hypothetical protein